MANDWLEKLKELVEKKPIVLLRFEDEEWDNLRESRNGLSQFSIARPRGEMNQITPPRLCLIHGKSYGGELLCLGAISYKGAASTLDIYIKVRLGREIQPHSFASLLSKLGSNRHKKNLLNRLDSHGTVTLLSPKLSIYLVQILSQITSNHSALETLTEFLSTPKHFSNIYAQQYDAVRTAIKILGLPPDEQAVLYIAS